MKIFNNIVRGASTQFGREFGRAAANSVLNGKNSYVVENKSYEGRIKQSDSAIVKGIKELNKISFVTTDKGNISRLIDMTNIVISLSYFNGIDTLLEINDYNILLEVYNQKYEHGNALISDNNTTKEFDFFTTRRLRLEKLIDSFNKKLENFVNANKENYTKNRKLKKSFIKKHLIGVFIFIVISFIGRLLNVPPVMNLGLLIIIIQFIKLIIILFTSQNKIDEKHNVGYLFFQKYSI